MHVSQSQKWISWTVTFSFDIFRMLHYIEEVALRSITKDINTALQERPNICFGVKIYDSKNQRGTYYRPIHELKLSLGSG